MAEVEAAPAVLPGKEILQTDEVTKAVEKVVVENGDRSTETEVSEGSVEVAASEKEPLEPATDIDVVVDPPVVSELKFEDLAQKVEEPMVTETETVVPQKLEVAAVTKTERPEGADTIKEAEDPDVVTEGVIKEQLKVVDEEGVEDEKESNPEAETNAEDAIKLPAEVTATGNDKVVY